MRVSVAFFLLLSVAGCATKGQMQRIETQLAMQQREQERRDSTMRAMMEDVIGNQRSTLDSLESTRRAITLAKGENSAEVVELQRAILALQENLNQSNRRLNEFYAQLDARESAMQPVQLDSTGAPLPGRPASGIQMLEAGQLQLNRGAMTTARAAFQELLTTYPTSTLAPDALYGIAQTYEGSAKPDSATAYFREVAQNYPDSPRAPSAMFKLGDQAQAAGDLATAKRWFQQVASAKYRGAPEYNVAQQRLRQLP
jgi:tol-pal system protein YbgF